MSRPNGPGTGDGADLDPSVRIGLLKAMMLSRTLESACCELNPRWFPAEGEEGVIAGAFFGLREDDARAPHYRGPFLAYALRGADLSRLVGQALGKANGYARGRALGFTGPAEMGFVPWVAGDLGTTIGVATGCALGFSYEGSDRVTVCSFGDGTTNRGDFHEALNLASVWKLPIVYVCQHNQYSISLHASEVLPVEQISVRASGYGMPGLTVDGNDVFAVHSAVRDAVARARAGDGPTLIEARTYRLGGHWAADPGGYRLPEVQDAWRDKDPIPRAVFKLVTSGALTQHDVDVMWDEVRQAVDAAVTVAKACPDARIEDIGADEVFADVSEGTCALRGEWGDPWRA